MPRGGRRPGAGRKPNQPERVKPVLVLPQAAPEPNQTTHGLYSRCIPADWKEPYDYYKTDPNYLSLRSEIALAQVNMDRFLARCEGKEWTTKQREQLGAHIERISRLKEREARRTLSESVVQEIIAQQAQAEARLLRDILLRYVDADTADHIALALADALAGSQASGFGAGVTLNI